MTLNTSIVFRTPVDAEKAFGIARRLAEVPADNPIRTGDKFASACYPTTAFFGHTICGAKAAVDMYVAFDGHPESKYCGDECVESGGCTPSCRDWYVHISLDTTYGANPCCACIHMNIIHALYEAFPEADIAWDDEFTGEWFNASPPKQCKDHSGLKYNGLIFKPEYAA